MELIVGMQSRRMDEQRAMLPVPQLPGLTNQKAVLQKLSRPVTDNSAVPDDDFLDMLMRCQVGKFISYLCCPFE